MKDGLGKDVAEQRILHVQVLLMITPGHSLRGGKTTLTVLNGYYTLGEVGNTKRRRGVT